MQRHQILERVLARLEEGFSSDGASLDATTRLSESGLLDSFDVLRIIMLLEDEFDVDFDRSDLDDLDTPARIAELIFGKLPGDR